MMDKDKRFTEVQLNVVSTAGHDEIKLPAGQAINEIGNQCTTKNKWLYINGVHRNPQDITVDEVLEAEDITLTNALMGG